MKKVTVKTEKAVKKLTAKKVVKIKSVKKTPKSLKPTADKSVEMPMKYKQPDDKNIPVTRVHGKEFSPLIIRRYSMPMLAFVALITDDNLDDLDFHVRGFFESYGIKNGIQEMRNLAGAMTDHLAKIYTKSEGVAVVLQADKMTVSSLAGDFMNHDACRIEFYGLLNFATGV